MVYLFLADGFEECEALVPLDILRRGNIPIKTVGIGKELICGTHNITVKADILDSDVRFDDLDAVILPGGMPGTNNLENNTTVIETVKFANKNNKLICAICAAPKILGSLGMLKDRNATCFPGFEGDLINALVTNKAVVKDGNIITARGAGVAFEFGFEILAELTSKETADNLKLSMQCDGGLK